MARGTLMSSTRITSCRTIGYLPLELSCDYLGRWFDKHSNRQTELGAAGALF